MYRNRETKNESSVKDLMNCVFDYMRNNNV